jgi:DNA polymerase III delta subunit
MGQWVENAAGAAGKRIENAAVRELLRRAGTHLSDVKNALALVLGYAQHSEVLRESDVVAACADVAEEEVWALTDAIAASNPAAALQAVKKLTEFGQEEDALLGMINWLIKTAYTVARNESGSSLSPFLVQKMRPLVNKLGLTKLKAAFSLITDTQFMMRTTGVDRNLALELLVLKLAAPRA